MRRLLVGLVVVAALSGCYRPGIVSTANHPQGAVAATSLGAHVARVGFDPCTSQAAMDADIDAFADQGIEVVPLIEFSEELSTSAGRTCLAAWAARYGVGGAFWSLPGHVYTVPVTAIEFGNESSYQKDCTGGSWWTTSCYTTRAQNYAHQFMDARGKMDYALAAAGMSTSAVKLLAQADDGGSSNSSWVDNMYLAEPNMGPKVGGWTVHPYGPSPTGKTGRTVSYTDAHWSSSIPIEVTEIGVASDNGNTLDSNHGWPTNLTYAQAAADLNAAVAAIKSQLGDRLELMLVYSSNDLQPSGDGQGEHYYGALKNTLADKGGYSTEVRYQMGQ